MLFIILPFIVNSQTAQEDFKRNMKRYDNDWAARTRMNHMGNKTTATDSKIFSEEKNKIKLEEKIAKLEDEVKSKKEQLTKLEDSNQNTTETAAIKKIKKAKEQLAKSEENLSKSKSDLEISAKKLEDLQKERRISLTAKVDREKKEKEEKDRKQSQEDINKALLKNLKTN